MKKIIVSVTNDLVTDQRVKKICQVLFDQGYDILLVGRKLNSSLPIERSYRCHRFRLLFNKGPLFYMEYNIRLFFFLLFQRKDILLANDLDTLLANYCAKQLNFGSCSLIYDSHEWYTQTPELINRPFVQKIWLKIEGYIFPKLNKVYTVNHLIAKVYSEKYKVPVRVIKNLAPQIQKPNKNLRLAEEIKGNRFLIILQGAGINIDRGAEEAVEMMQYLDNCLLLIAGDGDVIPQLKERCKTLQINDKVHFKNKMPYSELIEYTKIADLALSLDKNTNKNYEYSLPNKIFDYIQCRVPVMVSDRILIKQLVESEDIGVVIDHHNPAKMAQVAQEMLCNKEKRKHWKIQLEKAAQKHHWGSESKKLIQIFKS